MFVCTSCSNCSLPHMNSYGRCEVCGKVKECYDCPPWHYTAKVEEDKEKEAKSNLVQSLDLVKKAFEGIDLSKLSRDEQDNLHAAVVGLMHKIDPTSAQPAPKKTKRPKRAKETK